jgi:hypothetical protein
MRRLIFTLALLLGAVAAPAFAGSCPAYPYTLVNGQLADANQVMSDFNNVRNCFINNGAANNANSDITSLNGLTTPLSVAQGGTGSTTAGGATAGALTPGGTIGITGDLTYTSPTFTGANVTGAGTLATVNASPGTYANATVTVNAKGLATTVIASPAASTSVQGPTTLATAAQVATGTDTTHAVTPASLTVLTVNANPGCASLPGGLVLAFGVTASVAGNSSTTATFGCTFPTAALSATITPSSAFGSGGQLHDVVTAISTTQITVKNNSNGSGAFYYMVIGD